MEGEGTQDTPCAILRELIKGCAKDGRSNYTRQASSTAPPPSPSSQYPRCWWCHLNNSTGVIQTLVLSESVLRDNIKHAVKSHVTYPPSLWVLEEVNDSGSKHASACCSLRRPSREQWSLPFDKIRTGAFTSLCAGLSTNSYCLPLFQQALQ